MGRYVAVWVAMGDIHPDSGPFEFVPGSHKWPYLRGDKVRAWIKPKAREDVHDWATAAEYFVNRSLERYMKELGVKPIYFDAKKGDLLIWHAKLMHRGSIPKNPELSRPALISHYSSIRASRHIGPEITRHGDGGYFWEYSHIGEVLTEDKIRRNDFASAADRFNGKLHGYVGGLWRREGVVARNLAS
jgi:hypothetical protein